jgi:pyruvate,water dikinase
MKRLVPIASATSREQHGGKGEHLGFLSGLKLRVPPGAVVPASAFVDHIATCQGTGGDLAAAVLARPVDPELVSELVALARELGGRVSVRSSATLEDAKTHSFAGQFLTVLDVGPDDVADAVRRVWASAFADNVKAYLARAGLDPKKLAMAVVVQKQLDSRASGVAMGDRSRAVVEAVLGQGEALVSGEAAADQWEVKDGKIVSRTIAEKKTRRVLAAAGPNGAPVREDVPEDERNKPALTDAQILEAAASCARIAEASSGRPQDCEFAFAGNELHLLQTRDVTASLPVTAPPLGPFAAPGKGAWSLDLTHLHRPTTRLFQEIFPSAMTTGFKKSAERFGALISHADIAFVNGFLYTRMRPLMAPEDATTKPPPPKLLLKILLALAPPMRRRVKTAERIWKTREWRAQLEEWKTAKARAIEEHVRIQSVDLKKLDDVALAAHFRTACSHVGAMVEQHHTYNFAVMVPCGDLLAHVERWSKGSAAAADVLTLIAGSAPISADLRTKESLVMGAGLAADPEARRLLALDNPGHRAPGDAEAAEALASLRARPGATGAAVREFLAHREFRLVEGLDPGAAAMREHPELLWRALRVTATSDASAHDDAIDPAALARVRSAVPAEHHVELDALIEEARLVASLRDERALYSDVWAWGILRTVVLAIGERLLARPRKEGEPAPLVMASDLLHASSSEIESLLLHARRAQGPSATELESRAAFARAHTTNDAPAHLGPPELPPPPPDLFSGGAARLSSAFMGLLPHIMAPRKEQSGSSALVGVPASGGVHEGTAHVIDSHDDVAGIEPGTVLVVGAGSSSFTMMAPLASAVVAEGGGLLSHVAIVCREYRIPCVVGCSGVLTAVKSGQRLRVDGTRGAVELLGPAPAEGSKRASDAKPRERAQGSDTPPAP